MTNEQLEDQNEIGIVGVFPEPVMTCKVDASLFSDQIDTLKSLEYRTKEDLGGGTGRDVSYETHVLHMREFDGLMKVICDKANYFAREVMSIDCDLRVTQSWVNRSEKTDWTHEHAHPNSIVSGVLYFSVPGGSRIRFHKNTVKCGLYEIRPKINIEKSSERPFSWSWNDVGVQTSTLVLFPSYLIHSVPPNEDDETRWSLAFNTFPISGVGVQQELTFVDYSKIGFRKVL